MRRIRTCEFWRYVGADKPYYEVRAEGDYVRLWADGDTKLEALKNLKKELRTHLSLDMFSDLLDFAIRAEKFNQEEYNSWKVSNT